MILDISYEFQTILLRSTVSGNENIFDVDSLTLIIGKNGSGKTELLRSIATELTSPDFNEFGNESTLRFSSGNEHEKLEWGCVYYTPVPYQQEFIHRDRFENASLIDKKKSTFENLHKHNNTFKEFGINYNLTATSRVSTRPIIKNILTTAISNMSSNNKSCFVFFSKFKYFEKTLQLMRNRDTLLEDIGEYIDSLTKYKKALQDEIIDWLTSNFSTCQIISFFISINSMKKSTNQTNNRRALYLFILFFGKDEEGRKIRKPSNYEEFKADYNHILKFLKKNNSSFSYDWGNNFIIHLKDHSIIRQIERDELKGHFKINYNSMSSGELAVMNQFTSITTKLNKLSREGIKKILILIDEGDAFLHLEWQRMYIFHINKLLSEIKTENNIEIIQVIMATHSPLLATDVPRQFVFSLDKDATPKFTFASPMHMLFSESFGTSTIGEFATTKINEIYNNFTSKNASGKDYKILEYIDSDILKREFERQFNLGEEK
ncbi:AAA family ATPase [Klebsiella sp. JL973]|uniref:AAA family ATPase n=1 Tax=Klebsiella sp. JL973 TaxID=2652395 RepID=UPI0012D92998|nr:AAA family ATPase [Klebsiella sp. JL973]MTW39754.1 AAA family ATPase [Klebsiella sp. JL973]